MVGVSDKILNYAASLQQFSVDDIPADVISDVERNNVYRYKENLVFRGVNYDSDGNIINNKSHTDLGESVRIIGAQSGIDITVTEKASEIVSGIVISKSAEAPLIPAGAVVRHTVFGDGQIVALEASFPECPAKTFKIPYLHSLPDEICFGVDGKTLFHDRFGEGAVYAYIVVFKDCIIPLVYPSTFETGELLIE